MGPNVDKFVAQPRCLRFPEAVNNLGAWLGKASSRRWLGFFFKMYIYIKGLAWIKPSKKDKAAAFSY